MAVATSYITPSFYSSVFYWQKKEQSDRQELLDLIDKKPIETTPLMQEGIDFEDDVVRVCSDGIPSKDEVANEVAEIVNGCLWQEKIKTEATCGDNKILIYGRIDCLKRDWVYDIKCVKRYELGKYFDSIQHLAYMKATGLENFKYLVKCGKNLYTEDYHYTGEQVDKLLTERVFALINWLKNVGLYERYLVKWGLNK